LNRFRRILTNYLRINRTTTTTTMKNQPIRRIPFTGVVLAG
jgi:hypothetical protein